MHEIKPGDFGCITYLDDGSFWVVQQVCIFNLIVSHADNPKNLIVCPIEDFWPLVNLS